MTPRTLFALLLASLFLAVGCMPTTNSGSDDATADRDDDGLTDVFEQSIRTDPALWDTDGDGYSDSVEYLTYYSPRNADDFPYEGGYPRGPLMGQDDWETYTENSGWDEDSITSGWKVTDQHGQQIKLKRFFGNVVLIDVAAEWCGPCRIAAEGLEEEYTSRKDQGFVVIQLLLDGYGMGDGSPDAARWLEEFGLTLPVIEDGDYHAAERYVPLGGSFSIPNYTVIDRQHRIRTWYQAGGEPPWDFIDSLLEEERPEVDYPMPGNAAELYASLGIEANTWVQ